MRLLNLTLIVLLLGIVIVSSLLANPFNERLNVDGKELGVGEIHTYRIYNTRNASVDCDGPIVVDNVWARYGCIDGFTNDTITTKGVVTFPSVRDYYGPWNEDFFFYYFGTLKGFLTLVEVERVVGSIFLNYTIYGAPSIYGYRVNNITWFNEVYVGNVGGEFYRVDNTIVIPGEYAPPNVTFNIVWKYQVNSSIYCSPLIHCVNNTTRYIVFGDEEGYLYALDNNGNLRWKLKLDSGIISSPAEVNDMLYVVTENGTAYLLDVMNGSIYKSYNLGERVTTTPALDSNGYMYITTESNRTYCLNGNLSEVWNFSLNGTPNSPALLIYNRTTPIQKAVCITTRNGHFYVLHAYNGTLVFNRTLNDSIYVSPVSFGNPLHSQVHIVTMHGYFYIYRYPNTWKYNEIDWPASNFTIDMIINIFRNGDIGVLYLTSDGQLYILYSNIVSEFHFSYLYLLILISLLLSFVHLFHKYHNRDIEIYLMNIKRLGK